ncbi:MAG: hypothetical protein J5644_06525 [Bacteroidales bacterium]|nr:hypothetical protein [Bacteroidales bacterium]
MKRIIFFIELACLCAILLNSCQPASKEMHSVSVGEVAVQNGDLLFVGIPQDYHLSDTASMDEAITSATGQEGKVNYIHVAILEVDEHDSLWVIDATIKHGVDRHPFGVFLSDFTLTDGSLPVMEVMRLKDNAEAAMYVEKAKTFVGRGYDMYFSPDNDEQYCSELVRNSYITNRGTYLFDEAPMNFKSADGTFPPYWVELFDLLGEPIPQGVPGTNPADMSKAEKLKRVGEWTVNRK